MAQECGITLLQEQRMQPALKRKHQKLNSGFMVPSSGDYQSALNDFESSLRVEPNGVAAFFSKGECLMKLGKLKDAEAVFEVGVKRFPEQKDMFNKYLNTTRSMMKKG